MADITLASDQQGAYELSIPAGTTIRVNAEPADDHYDGALRLFAHASATPLYARRGNTVTTKDPKAVMVIAGSWVMLNDTPAYSLNRPATITYAITSASDATITIERA